MARLSSDSYAISITGMMGAFALLFLYLAAIVPTGKLSMYAIASLFSIAMCIEQRTGLAIIMFIGVSGLSMLIVPNILTAVPYILFFGHYGIAKYHFEQIKDKVFAFVLKLAYFNAGLLLNYFLVKNILLATIPDFLKDNFWIFLLAAQVVFVAYDFIYSQMAVLYYNRIRRFLMRRGE